MDKQILRQSRLDIARLENAAGRIRDLTDAYQNTLNDLRIAQQGLKLIATWASVSAQKDIFDRAMDTLSLISEANR